MAQETLIQKIRSLPPERVAEVEDFVDFLTVRDQDRRLTQAATRMSKTRSALYGTTPTMPSTTAYSFGDVVLVPFPFTDQTTSKKRPAVVVSVDAYQQKRPDVIVMAVTSQILRWAAAVGEVLITDWQGAGCRRHPLSSPFWRRLSSV